MSSECISWAEAVPRDTAEAWAKTFGLRLQLGAFRSLTVSGRVLPMLMRRGVVACPHGFCIARARVDEDVAFTTAVRMGGFPDSAEVCACLAEVPTGEGWCYLDGFERRDARTAAALLRGGPTVERILDLCPEYDAAVCWDGEDRAHVVGHGRYALVNLPAEVVVGGHATCRALGLGHLTSGYCSACETKVEGYPQEPVAAVRAHLDRAPVVADVSVMEVAAVVDCGGPHDAIWVRKGNGPSTCSVGVSPGRSAMVGACECVPPAMVGVVNVLTARHGRDGFGWRRLDINTPTSWSFVCQPGEVLVVPGGHIRCRKTTVVFCRGTGQVMVFADRVQFTVCAHTEVADKRIRHLRFNIGGFTHWKVLCKAEPYCVWKPSGAPEESDASGIRVVEDVPGLGSRYQVEGSAGNLVARGILPGAAHGFIVRGGTYELSACGFVAAPDYSVWVFLGGTSYSSLELEESKWRFRPAIERGSVIALADDYELDDAGPSSGESDFSVGGT